MGVLLRGFQSCKTHKRGINQYECLRQPTKSRPLLGIMVDHDDFARMVRDKKFL